MMDYATPIANVSAFCRAVLSKLIPNEFWGLGEVQSHNMRVFSRNVDRFITLRRFESLSLHEVVQGMKVRIQTCKRDNETRGSASLQLVTSSLGSSL